MENKIRRKTTADGFRVSYLADAETDWCSVFESLERAWGDGVLLQKTETSREIRETKMFGASLSVPFVAKKIFRKTRFSVLRAFRETFCSIGRGDMIRIVESSYEKGFTFPARIYLIAERHVRGILRERVVFTELIRGKPLGSFSGREKLCEELMESAHRHGLTWGGDPNPENFMLDENGVVRGIDFAFRKASWRSCGRDWEDAREHFGLVSSKFRLCEIFVRFISSLKKR
ncbi:MAG: lipopolysaccharide core heptose(II) kinase RfaY [Candidatus Spyradosoma sp.]